MVKKACWFPALNWTNLLAVEPLACTRNAAPLTAYLAYSCASLKQSGMGSLQEKLLDGQAVHNAGKQKMLASLWQVFLQRERIAQATTHFRGLKSSLICVSKTRSHSLLTSPRNYLILISATKLLLLCW